MLFLVSDPFIMWTGMKWWMIPAVLTIGWTGAACADTTGWEYLIDKLSADGVPRSRVVAAFADPRIPAFTELQFSADPPRESNLMYRGFLRPANVSAARSCRQRYAESFQRAERKYGVSANVVAAILHIETGCGRNTGSSVVLYRLARLAMANEPANRARNLARLRALGDKYDPDLEIRVGRRGNYLEETFYPEVRALFEVADRLRIDPVDLRGSPAGAFGFPQFLPTSFLAHATDGNGDGRISLYDFDDAVASCARYLAHYGWVPGIPRSDQRGIIWHYNRSDAYIDAVLGVAARLSVPGPPQATKSRMVKEKKPAGKGRTKIALRVTEKRR